MSFLFGHETFHRRMSTAMASRQAVPNVFRYYKVLEFYHFYTRALNSYTSGIINKLYIQVCNIHMWKKNCGMGIQKKKKKSTKNWEIHLHHCYICCAHTVAIYSKWNFKRHQKGNDLYTVVPLSEGTPHQYSSAHGNLNLRWKPTD